MNKFLDKLINYDFWGCLMCFDLFYNCLVKKKEQHDFGGTAGKKERYRFGPDRGKIYRFFSKTPVIFSSLVLFFFH